MGLKDPTETYRNYSFPLIGFGSSKVRAAGTWLVVNPSETGEWLQIDLGENRTVSGVVTSAGDEGFVDLFTIGFDHTPYSPVKLLGPTEVRGKKKALLPSPAHARYVSLYPMSWTGAISMRAGVLVCESLDELINNDDE